MNKDIRNSVMQLAAASSVGIAMVLAIFGCLYLGIYLDRKFDTGNFFKVLLLFMGIAAGFRNLYVLIKRYFPNEKPVINSLKSEQHRKRPHPDKNLNS
ncbi:MAG: AtpZ/AtpI family protein [Smithella sp.]